MNRVDSTLWFVRNKYIIKMNSMNPELLKDLIEVYIPYYDKEFKPRENAYQNQLTYAHLSNLGKQEFIDFFQCCPVKIFQN